MTKLMIKDEGDVRRMRLSNPERHNAFDDGLVSDLHDAFRDVGEADEIRAVVLASEGPSFVQVQTWRGCGRMPRPVAMKILPTPKGCPRIVGGGDCPKPVIARVQGAAYGGGVGLVAACDLAYALPSAAFALTEVRLGLIPAVIAPFLLGKMGPGAVRAWASRVPASTPPEPQIWGWCIRWLMKMDWTWPSTPRLTAFGVRPGRDCGLESSAATASRSR